MPAVQSSHSLCPDADWDCPFGQAVHFDTPCFLAMRPASQAVHDELPSVAAKVPLVHSSHLLWPAALWLLPLAQFTHDRAPSRLCARPEAQNVQAAEPSASAKVPAEQFKHDTVPELLYFPAGQILQFAFRSVLKVPGLQLVQEVAPTCIPVANPAAQVSHADAPESL